MKDKFQGQNQGALPTRKTGPMQRAPLPTGMHEHAGLTFDSQEKKAAVFLDALDYRVVNPDQQVTAGESTEGTDLLSIQPT